MTAHIDGGAASRVHTVYIEELHYKPWRNKASDQQTSLASKNLRWVSAYLVSMNSMMHRHAAAAAAPRLP